MPSSPPSLNSQNKMLDVELGELICFIDIKSRATLWAEYLKIAVVFLLF